MQSTAAENVPATDAMGGNVEKIRDILFGAHMRDYDARFARLEENLIAQTTDLRETTNRRLEALEQYVKGEFEALQARLKTERDERTQQCAQIARELRETGDALHQKLRQLEDEAGESNRGLRAQLLQQSNQLLDEMRSRQAELTALLERRAKDLSVAKADRSLVAALFTEAAMKLNDEFRIPGAEG
jgi:DNA repair exonuclease SbcCD ATPase subunit